MATKGRGGKSGGRAVKAVGSYLGACPGFRTERCRKIRDRAGEVREGIVGGRPPEAGTVEEASRTAISRGPCGRRSSGELNLGSGATGEARSAAVQETETRAARACLERPAAGADRPCPQGRRRGTRHGRPVV